MPSRHQSIEILSPQQTKWFKHTERITHFALSGAFRNPQLPILRPLTDFPLAELVSSSPGWSSYCRDFLPVVWNIQPSSPQMEARSQPSWSSVHKPLFRWNEDNEPEWEYSRNPLTGNRRPVVPRAIANDWERGNIDFWRDRRTEWDDPAVGQFYLDIEQADSQEELNERLLLHFPPRYVWSEFDERRNTAFGQSVDLVFVLESNWMSPLMSTDATPLSPLCAAEYDGMTGFRIVEGELRYSPDAVGRTFRYNRGHRDTGQVIVEDVQAREQKTNDKLAILTDLGIPSTVIPHDSLMCYYGLGMEFMLSDISMMYLIASSYHNNPRVNENMPPATSDAARWNLIAPHTFLGNNFIMLSNPYNSTSGVTIERIRTSIPPSEDSPFSRSIVQSDLYDERLERLNADGARARFYSNMGVDPENCVGIRLTVEHPRHGNQFHEEPLDPLLFSGSTVNPGDDHVMLAGLASGILLARINELDQQTT